MWINVKWTLNVWKVCFRIHFCLLFCTEISHYTKGQLSMHARNKKVMFEVYIRSDGNSWLMNVKKNWKARLITFCSSISSEGNSKMASRSGSHHFFARKPYVKSFTFCWITELLLHINPKYFLLLQTQFINFTIRIKFFSFCYYLKFDTLWW